MSAPAPVRASALAFVTGLASILAAWGFQIFGGYIPCKLCLIERIPYYTGLPVLLLGLLLASRAPLVARGLYVIAGLLFFAGVAVGSYHAGAEWNLWAGPSDCGGTQVTVTDASNLLAAMQHTRIVSCTEATFRLFGIFSFAGLNVLASGFVGLLAFRAATTSRDALI
ncbi:disulfide bond formation protein B [Oryzibacter oryziterrae]|uniref:disulfide bond formation protein B n=1 Tax=Oryzibacter oryziterrae TaxID=2766474 RepID=UPI001F30103B|nr:disulfide bond formation protein B [Oryzibacter oryziterrae]